MADLGTRPIAPCVPLPAVPARAPAIDRVHRQSLERLGYRFRWGVMFGQRDELRVDGEVLRAGYPVEGPDGQTLWLAAVGFEHEYEVRSDRWCWRALSFPMPLEQARREAARMLTRQIAAKFADPRVAKLEQMTEERGATPAEAATARRLAERIAQTSPHGGRR